MLFVLAFPVTVLAWLGFGVGVAMVAVLDADAPKPPPASSLPMPDGWSVVDDKECDAKNCSTRTVVVQAPATGEVLPPARRLITSLSDRGWRVDADTPALAESPEGITVDAAPPIPPAPVEPDPGAAATSTTTVVTKPPPTRAGATSTTASTTTTLPATTTTVSPAVAATRATITVGFRSEAGGRAYHREGVAMQHITGFYRLLAWVTGATLVLGLLLFVLDQFVS